MPVNIPKSVYATILRQYSATGSISKAAAAAGVSRHCVRETINRSKAGGPLAPVGQLGRKKTRKARTDGMMAALEKLMQSEACQTCYLDELQAQLQELGHAASKPTLLRAVAELGYTHKKLDNRQESEAPSWITTLEMHA
jgi:transposase